MSELKPVDCLPTITAEDRQFLHHNPNTQDVVDWVVGYALASIDEWNRRAQPEPGRDEVSLLAEIAEAVQAMRAYARANPIHHFGETPQDPNGVHAWLRRNDPAHAAQPEPAAPAGEVVVTTRPDGTCVAVTRQDADGRILSVIWQADAAPSVAPEPVAWTLQSELDAAQTTCSSHLWFTNPRNSAWTALFTREKIAAHPPRAPLSPWQPMKTAPKDGTAVLVLLDASDIPHAARWLSGPDDRRATEETTRAGWHLTWDGSPIEEHDGPRYWMHCPDDPDESDIEAAHGIGGK